MALALTCGRRGTFEIDALSNCRVGRGWKGARAAVASRLWQEAPGARGTLALFHRRGYRGQGSNDSEHFACEPPQIFSPLEEVPCECSPKNDPAKKAVASLRRTQCGCSGRP